MNWYEADDHIVNFVDDLDDVGVLKELLKIGALDADKMRDLLYTVLMERDCDEDDYDPIEPEREEQNV